MHCNPECCYFGFGPCEVADPLCFCVTNVSVKVRPPPPQLGRGGDKGDPGGAQNVPIPTCVGLRVLHKESTKVDWCPRWGRPQVGEVGGSPSCSCGTKRVYVFQI